MTRKEIKAIARKDLGDKLFCEKWMMALLLIIVVEAIIGVSAVVPVLGTLLVTGPMLIGMSAVMLTMSRRETPADIGELFKEGFAKDFGRAFLLGLMEMIFIFLWSLLFTIPGLVKTYSYAMAPYIAVDHPEYGWKECITQSRVMMNGHKWELFVLELSFIGWALVCLLTCGIGYLWLAPYMNQSRTVFYRNLINDFAVVEAEYTEAENKEDDYSEF